MKEVKLKVFNDFLLIILALLSVGLLLLEISTELSADMLMTIRIIDLGVALVFGVEFLVRLSESREKGRFMKENWWQILASIPVTATGTQALRGLMLIRVLRVVRMTSMIARVSLFSKSLSRILKETHMATIVTLLGVVLIGGAMSFYYFEQPTNPNVDNFYDSFWFISDAMTSTGVGEVYPMTSAGRAVGILSMFSGVFIFGLFVAFIASHLVHSRQKDN